MKTTLLTWMKNGLTIVIIILFTSVKKYQSSVYICGNSGAKKYHYTENCRGLNSCTHGVVKTSIKQAQGLGLTLCGWED